MIDKKHAIATVIEDIGAKVRLSKIRGGLHNAGFSPEETREIISIAVDQRRANRHRASSPRRDAAIVAIAAVTLIAIGVVIAWAMASIGGLLIIPIGLLCCGAWLWSRKPESK
jgi:hypothetical protein